MIQVEVNGKKATAKPGEMLLSVLRKQGIEVPTLCHMENLTPAGACRLCVVEVEGRPNLLPSCATPVADGMQIQTHSPRVLRARKTVVELLLASHPNDCLYCVRSDGCDLRQLAAELGVQERSFGGQRKQMSMDLSSPALVREPSKCIMCGRCVRVCSEVQGVSAVDFIGRGNDVHVGTAFDLGLNVSSCVYCGQCIMVCPTGALSEQSHIDDVLAALADPRKHVVVQHAPSVSVTIGEEFGMKKGVDAVGVLTAALRRLGFARVFDTAFAADLTIMEEASELIHRIQEGGRLPMLTSCSPGWIKFVEQFYPEFTGNLSTCKSPQQMLGAIIKSFYAERNELLPEEVYSVSIMPCTAKKFEAGRYEMQRDGVADVDAVLTTRELVHILRRKRLDLASLAPEGQDSPFGERSTAGKLFGATGGVMEAAVRTAHYLITGRELEGVKFEAVRGLNGIKEARVKVDGLELGLAAVSGLGNAGKVLEQIRRGRNDLHFIEVMTCPGGCIAGGGQPRETSVEAVKERMQALYRIDREEPLRNSHSNPSIRRLYEEFLGEPLGAKSHELLHTHYVRRELAV